MSIMHYESPNAEQWRRSCAVGLLLLSCCWGCETQRIPANSVPWDQSSVGPFGGELIVTDVDSQSVTLFSDDANAATVLLFSRVDCPISNRYAPEVSRLVSEYAPRGVAFWLVYADPQTSGSEVRAHHAEFAYPCPALMDPGHELVRRTGVQVTPEVAVYDADWRLAYRGRIDNRFVDFGKFRPEPTVRDLERALQSLLDGNWFGVKTTEAIGCPIASLPQR